MSRNYEIRVQKRWRMTLDEKLIIANRIQHICRDSQKAESRHNCELLKNQLSCQGHENTKEGR